MYVYIYYLSMHIFVCFYVCIYIFLSYMYTIYIQKVQYMCVYIGLVARTYIYMHPVEQVKDLLQLYSLTPADNPAVMTRPPPPLPPCQIH